MTVTVVRRDAGRRWLVVAAVVAALCAAPAVRDAWPVASPRIATAALADRIRASGQVGYRGYAVSSSALGVPTLPRLGDVTSLLDGTTRLRTWHLSSTRSRVDVVGADSERDLYQTPAGQYVWDYDSNLLTEIVGTTPARLPRGADLLPPDLGRRLLADGRGDRVSALGARRVAGVTAAGLRVTPRDPRTIVGHVDIWADPGTGLPVRVAVSGRGHGAPVLVSRFLDLSLGRPDASVLRPPVVAAGVGRDITSGPDVVTSFDSLGLGPLPASLAGSRRNSTAATLESVGVYGTGFTQVAVLSVPRDVGFDAFRSALRAGGRLVHFTAGAGVVVKTPLVTALVMDSDPARRTFILAGMVDGAQLTRTGDALSTAAER